MESTLHKAKPKGRGTNNGQKSVLLPAQHQCNNQDLRVFDESLRGSSWLPIQSASSFPTRTETWTRAVFQSEISRDPCSYGEQACGGGAPLLALTSTCAHWVHWASFGVLPSVSCSTVLLVCDVL